MCALPVPPLSLPCGSCPCAPWCVPQAITEHGLYQRTPEQIPDGAWGEGMVTLVGDAAHTAYVDGTGLALSLGARAALRAAQPPVGCKLFGQALQLLVAATTLAASCKPHCLHSLIMSVSVPPAGHAVLLHAAPWLVCLNTLAWCGAEDAAVLGWHVQQQGLSEAALRAFEAERIPRVKEVFALTDKHAAKMREGQYV